MKEDNYIDQFFKDKFEGHQEVPPLHVWDKIENDLLEQKPKVINWKWVVGMAASILLLFSVVQVYNNSNRSAIDAIVKNAKMKNGVLELPADQIDKLMKEIKEKGLEDIVIVREAPLKEKKVNTNFLVNSPIKGREVQYYVEKKERNSRAPFFFSEGIRSSYAAPSNGLGVTVSSKK